MIKVIVQDKQRIIRDKYISVYEKYQLECKYRNHFIYILKDNSNNGFYAEVKDKSGRFLVQGGFGGCYSRYGIKTIEDCLAMCIDNILIK